LYPTLLKNRPHGIIENGKISPQISANKNIESIFTEKNNIYISFTVRPDRTRPAKADSLESAKGAGSR
jgi:hypothetical protein